MGFKPRDPGTASYTPNSNLEGVKFKYKHMPEHEDGPQHHLTAMKGRKKLGVLWWHSKTGEVGGVGVTPEAKGKGIATELWHEAHRMSQSSIRSQPLPPEQGRLFNDRRRTPPLIVPPQHSEVRTTAGSKWAESVGGEVPPLRYRAGM